MLYIYRHSHFKAGTTLGVRHIPQIRRDEVHAVLLAKALGFDAVHGG